MRKAVLKMLKNTGDEAAFVSDATLYDKEKAIPTTSVLPRPTIRGQENEGIAASVGNIKKC